MSAFSKIKNEGRGAYNNRPTQSDLHATLRLFIGQVQIDVNKYVQEFELEIPTSRSAKGRIVLFDHEWDVMEDFLFRQGMSTPVVVEFGFRGAFSLPIELRLGAYTPSFTQAGVTLDVELMDAAKVNNMIARSKGYKLDEFPRVSDIIFDICKRNKWKAVVEKTMKLTRPAHPQSNLPDTQYMVHVLQEKATNEWGLGGYRCYMEPPDIMHFHTPSYVLQTRNGIYRTYNFARELDGEVLKFTPEDHAIALTSIGASRANYECFDARTGEITTIVQREEGDSKRPLIGGGRIDKVTQGKAFHRFISRPFENQQEQKEYARQRSGAYNQLGFTATLEVLGDPFITPMHYVVVNVIKADGAIHERWSGRWIVRKVTHNLTPGSFTTTLQIQRESIGTGNLKLPGKTIPIKQNKAQRAPEFTENSKETKVETM